MDDSSANEIINLNVGGTRYVPNLSLAQNPLHYVCSCYAIL